MRFNIQDGPPSFAMIKAARDSRGKTLIVALLVMALAGFYMFLGPPASKFVVEAIGAVFVISAVIVLALYDNNSLDDLLPAQCDELAEVMKESETANRYVAQVNELGREAVVAELRALRFIVAKERDAARKEAVYGPSKRGN